MKLNKHLFILSFGIFAWSPGILSQETHRPNDLLVTGDWLEEHLEDSLLVVLHYGMKTEFKKEHIPGARYVTIWEFLTDDEQGRKHEFPEAQKLEQALRSLGLNNNSKIIICYQDGNAIPWAARLFVSLDYAGLGDQTAMLQGGLKAWKEEGRPVTNEVAAFAEGQVDIEIKEVVRISKEEVRAMRPVEGVVIVDARPGERYYGFSEDGNAARQGHIEGAVNLPYFQLTLDDSTHMFRTEGDLRQLFENHQASPESMIITYCGTGVWASAVYFAARFLGYPVRFYDGSFQEWSGDESLPVSKSATGVR